MSASVTTAPLLGEPMPIELMNTIWADRNGVHEALGSPLEALAWLRAVDERDDAPVRDLGPWLERATRRDLHQLHLDLRRLRDAARRLAARRTDDTRSAAQVDLSVTDAVVALNEYAATAQTWPTLEWPDAGGPHSKLVSAATPGSAVVGSLARATVTMLTGDSGGALRACQAPGCVLYFLKQHPRREWCSAACGNRARQARHYRRHSG